MRAILRTIGFIALLAASLASPAGAQTGALPERVTFTSADGHTALTGYLYRPSTSRAAAVVMMHGRAGAYSSKANGVYGASTLSKRHRMWGELLAGAGYFALMVDGFGPRGYPQGFPRHSYDSRPAELDEITVRPLDAYGAAAYLRTRPEIDAGRIGLIGWSNGGSATLAAMASGINPPAPETRFRAALVFYAGCKLKDRFEQDGYKPYAPVHVFHGTADEETSSRRCADLVESSRAQGGDIGITLYPDATHGFDDPGEKRQRVEANAAASEDAIRHGLRFFARHLH